jgi:hypothetical protein
VIVPAFLWLLTARCALAAPNAESAPLLAEASRQVEALESFLKTLDGGSWPANGWRVDSKTASDYCLGSAATLTSMPQREMEFEAACQAFEQDDLGACRDLRPSLAFSRSASTNCTLEFADLAVAYRASVSDPTSERLCREAVSILFVRGTAADAVNFCDVIGQDGSGGDLCGDLRRRVPAGFPADSKEGCEGVSYVLEGSDCSRFEFDEFQRALCPTFASFRKARSSRDVGVCGKDALCRLLMGDKEACVGQRRAWKESYCARAVGSGSEGKSGAFEKGVEAGIATTISGAGDMLFAAGEKEAISRLHERMMGARTIDEGAADDVLAVLNARIGDLLYRSESLLAGSPGESGGDERKRLAGQLRTRFAAARARYESLRAERKGR